MTGIIDSHAYMLALQGDAENAGAIPVFFSPALGAHVRGRKIDIDVGGADPMTLRCRLMVNSAGLHAPLLARRIVGMPADRVPTEYYAKGNYFTLAGRSPFSRLIYPVPVPGGLGVHLTIDLGGQARLCRHPAEDRAAWSSGAGLRRARATNARRSRPDQSVRNRKPWADGITGNSRSCAGNRGNRVVTAASAFDARSRLATPRQ
jgi:hypothetical protein